MSLFPTCIHLYVCVSGDVISMQWSGKSDICMSRVRRQVDILSEAPGTESAGPKENHTLRVLLTQKPQSSTTITDSQLSTTHTDNENRDSAEKREGAEAERERIRVKDSPVCIK